MQTTKGKPKAGGRASSDLGTVILCILVYEVVEGLEGASHLGLANLQAAAGLVIVADSDFAIGLLLFVGRPAPSDFPALLGLLEGWAGGGDVFEGAEGVEGVEDVEEDALCKLHIMIPSIRHFAKRISLGHDIQEDKQTLLDTNVRAHLTLHIGQNPIRQLEKGGLVEMAKVEEAVGDGEEELHGASLAQGFDAAAQFLEMGVFVVVDVVVIVGVVGMVVVLVVIVDGMPILRRGRRGRRGGIEIRRGQMRGPRRPRRSRQHLGFRGDVARVRVCVWPSDHDDCVCCIVYSEGVSPVGIEMVCRVVVVVVVVVEVEVEVDVVSSSVKISLVPPPLSYQPSQLPVPKPRYGYFCLPPLSQPSFDYSRYRIHCPVLFVVATKPVPQKPNPRTPKTQPLFPWEKSPPTPAPKPQPSVSDLANQPPKIKKYKTGLRRWEIKTKKPSQPQTLHSFCKTEKSG